MLTSVRNSFGFVPTKHASSKRRGRRPWCVVPRLAVPLVVLVSLSLTSVTDAGAETIRVRVTDTAFRPVAIRVALGDSVKWVNVGLHRHAVTSDPAGFFRVALAAGEEAHRQMRSAGTFRYHDRRQPDMRGVVRVPVITEPRTGATPGARITITLATARIRHRVYDVQWKRDDRRWRNLRKGVRKRRVFFVPSRTGRFAFRARVELTDSGTTSGWSPADRVIVAPPP